MYFQSKIIPPDSKWWKEQLLIIKFRTLLVLVSTLHISATALAQDYKINISAQNLSLKEVLMSIREQSGIDFIYQEEEIRGISNLNINANEIGVEYALEMCLEGTGLEYKIVDNIIVIKKANFQQRTITVKGKVTDNNGEPLSGVNIIIAEQNTGTVSSSDGMYEIKIPAENISLIFSSTGFKKQTIAVNGQTQINVILDTEISEIVM